MGKSALLALVLLSGPVGATQPESERLEYSVIPAVTYNRDDGLGMGLLGVLADFEEQYWPYRFRLEVLTFYYLREEVNGNLELPTHVHWVLVDFPGLLGPLVRIRFQAGYASLNRFYYGLGNDTPASEGSGRFYQFERAGPPIELTTRVTLPYNFYLVGIAQFTYNFIEVFDGSKLESDIDGDAGTFTRDALFGASEHALLLFKLSLEWDTRDHETVPRSGMFHEVQLQGGFGVPEDFGFGAVSLTSRFYQSLWREYLVVAARVLADLYFGRPPFYLMPYLGDPWSVRGVPAGRYRGKVRVVGNLELRSRFAAVQAGGHQFHFGVAAFVDTGRVWTDYDAHPELDGKGHGLKVGIGGGLRFQWGETVILRFDTAWSPDGLGYYLDISHIF